MMSRVLDAWHDLLEERGYGEVTLADVATRVGLSRSSLYRYVPDKVTLLQLLIDRSVVGFMSGLRVGLVEAPDASTKLEFFVRSQLRYFSSQRLLGHDMSTVLSAEQHAEVMVHLAPIRDLLRAIVAEGIDRGEFRALDVELTSGMVFSVIGAHQMPLARGDVSLEEVSDETVAFLLGAVGVGAAPDPVAPARP